jgi:hypothetical protein
MGVILQKEGKEELEGIFDSENVVDQETRLSVYDWNLYFCGARVVNGL